MPNSWTLNPQNEGAIWHIRLNPNGELQFPNAAFGVNRTLYFYEGDSIFIGDDTIHSNYGIALDPKQEAIIKTGSQEAKLLLLQGKPISEPIAQQGPFVMNTQAELRQAFEENRLPQFGGWPWPHPNNVHNKERGRFARYPNGNLEEKP
ncbi:MAG: pirin-like C-terminal cupin domain-containing protein [Bacteroidota bacterium]